MRYSGRELNKRKSERFKESGMPKHSPDLQNKLMSTTTKDLDRAAATTAQVGKVVQTRQEQRRKAMAVLRNTKGTRLP